MTKLLELAAPAGLLLILLATNACSSSSGGQNQAPGPQNSPPPPTSGQVTFASLNTVLVRDCAGSGCHAGGGSEQPQFVGNQSSVDLNRGEIASRVSSGNMPPSGGLSAADRQAILTYCNQ